MISKSNSKNIGLNLLLLLCLFFLFLPGLKNKEIEICNNKIQITKQNEIILLKSSEYLDLTGSPIYIEGNSGWASAAANYDWCSGSGTSNDPYIIENVIFDGMGAGNCIEIRNSAAYFIIKNCITINSGSNSEDVGIKLDGCSNGQIINNNCSFNENGIQLINSDYNAISGNNISNNNHNGIIVDVSHNNNIFGNTANYNLENGMNIGTSNNSIISRNYLLRNNFNGIMMSDSFKN